MRIVIASLLSAIVLFFFGFLWFGILMPTVKPAGVITDATVVEKLGSSLTESNVYFHPDYTDHSEEHSGPVTMMFYATEARAMGMTMGLGFAHMFLTTLLVCIFLSSSPRHTFAGRLAFVFFLGLFVAVWADLGNMVWWHHPPMWTGYHFAYDALSWLLAGLVIALILKPTALEHESPA